MKTGINRKQAVGGKGGKWILGSLAGICVFLAGSALTACCVSSGRIGMDKVGIAAWVILSVGFLTGCAIAARLCVSGRMLHAGMTAGILLCVLAAGGSCFGTQKLPGLPYAAGIAAASVLFGCLLCSGRKNSYKL